MPTASECWACYVLAPSSCFQDGSGCSLRSLSPSCASRHAPWPLRNWIEQSYKQVKNSLGWAHYQVRKDISIRRHWQMVCLAFSFCWWESSDLLEAKTSPGVILEEKAHAPSIENRTTQGGKKERRSSEVSIPLVAAGAEESEGMARTIRNAHALLEGVLGSVPSTGARSVA